MKYFIDSNIIIDLLKDKQEIKDKLKTIIEDDDSELFINRLVLIESLRTIPFENRVVFEKAKKELEFFTKVEIKPEIYDKAISFSRFCKSKGINLKGRCEAIDFLHFMTARHYGLEMITDDKDFDKLEKSYKLFLESLKK